jgi:hypothetical protein
MDSSKPSFRLGIQNCLVNVSDIGTSLLKTRLKASAGACSLIDVSLRILLPSYAVIDPPLLFVAQATFGVSLSPFVLWFQVEVKVTQQSPLVHCRKAILSKIFRLFGACQDFIFCRSVSQ